MTMSLKRSKFATLHSHLSGSSSTPMLSTNLVQAEIEPSNCYSQGVTVGKLLGNKADVDTPTVKSILKSKSSYKPSQEKNLEQAFNSQTSSEQNHFDEMQPTYNIEGETSINAVYTFPSSPRIVKKKERKNSLKSLQQSREEQLIRYVFDALDEIEDIRKKRRILKEEGLNGLKKFKRLVV